MRLAALLTALLVVLAGCGGVMDVPVTGTPDDGTETPTRTPEPNVAVLNGDMPVEATTVFDRVVNLTDEPVPGPVVYVENPDAMSGLFDDRRSQFRSALGIHPPEREEDTIQASGYVPNDDGNAVFLNEAMFDDETKTELTLAHEFVHVVQIQSEWTESVWTIDPSVHSDGIDTDGELTYSLVVEGAATYVESDYGRQFLPESEPETDDLRADYRNGSAYERLNYAPYVFGADYVDDRVDSPGGIESVHRDPPASSEQVLHNSTDPVEDLTVTTDTGNWTPEHRDRQGELFLRIALRTELNESTAVDAAHGWGDDRRITFERGNRTATAWTLHWDDADNATEFEAAFDRYLDAKATQTGSVWAQTDGNTTYRVVEANNETTVVLLGNETFVRTATVNATQDDVLDIGIEE